VSTTPKKGVPNSKGTQFKPGQSGNIKGRPPLPPELRKKQGITGDEVRRMFALYADMTVDELRLKLQDPKLTGLEYNIVQAILDPIRFPFYLDRMVGKIPDKVESVNVHMAYDPEEYEAIPAEALMKLVSGDDK